MVPRISSLLPPSGEILASWPPPSAPPQPMARVRSTLVSSALAALRARGLYDRYRAQLAPEHHPAVDALIAGVWLPTDFVLAHYAACERLALSQDEAIAIGTAVGARIHDTVLLTVRKLAAGAGVTPWVPLAQYDRLWQRTFDGGGFTLRRLGPKDASLHVTHTPFARFAYFRGSFCGVHIAALRLFSSSGHVRVLATSVGDNEFALRASWV